MASGRNHGDDHIIQSTQTELAFFLVIVFVLLLGFQTTEEDRVAGMGDRVQGTPSNQTKEIPEVEETGTVAPAQHVPEPVPPVEAPIVPRDAEWLETADKSLLNVRSCRVERSAERRSFILPTDQLTVGGDRGMTFENGQHEISKELWDSCLAELFQAVIATYQEHQSDTKYVVIQGHTSSSWDTTRGCSGVPGSTDPGRAAVVAYKCNRRLSLKRADEVFEAGYFFNSQWRIVGADTALESVEFSNLFRTEGRSTLDLIHDNQGQEDASLSRRVEFVFVSE